MKTIYISPLPGYYPGTQYFIITTPRLDTNYVIHNTELPNYSLNITFQLTPEKEILRSGSNFNLTLLIFRQRLYLDKDSYWDLEVPTNEDKPFLIFEPSSMPPSASVNRSGIYYVEAETQEVRSITQIVLSLNTGQVIKYSSVPIPSLQLCNVELVRECEQELGRDIAILASKYPLFKTNARPSYRVLADLYDKFFRYNRDKINHQYNLSESFCAARAHLIFLLLKSYGIAAFKLFKQYTPGSWQQFDAENPWRYHCAIMVIDEDNNKWVWDPWIGNNSTLLSLTQWLNRNNEPKPSHLMVANPMVVLDWKEGKANSYSLVDTFLYNNNRFFKAFQALAQSALPNPPNKWLKIKKGESDKDLKKEDHLSLACNSIN